MTEAQRHIPRQDAKGLAPGSEHYSAYIGPPDQYDFMGATQFRLLTTLGLRETHRLLDFGCGSLRAGRLLISYLLPGHYYGVEPNAWLVEDAIQHEVGQDQIRLKRPCFSNNANFSVDEFGVKFDYIVAQSIFSHAGRDLIERALSNFRSNLQHDGLVLATFIHANTRGFGDEYGGNGWVYPGCVVYDPATIQRMIRAAGLHGALLPWFHPRKEWYVMAQSGDRLPPTAKYAHLSGAVLYDQEFSGSS